MAEPCTAYRMTKFSSRNRLFGSSRFSFTSTESAILTAERLREILRHELSAFESSFRYEINAVLDAVRSEIKCMPVKHCGNHAGETRTPEGWIGRFSTKSGQSRPQPSMEEDVNTGWIGRLSTKSGQSRLQPSMEEDFNTVVEDSDVDSDLRGWDDEEMPGNPKVRHRSTRRLIDLETDHEGYTAMTKEEHCEEEAEPATTFREQLTTLIGHPYFECISSFLILTNVLMIGLELDLSVQQGGMGEDAKKAFSMVNGVFCAVFVLELAARLWAYGSDFFTGSMKTFNILDLVLVTITAMDTTDSLVRQTSARTFNISWLRWIRLLKIVRTVRILRLCRFLSEFRALFFTIMASLRSMVWTMALFATVTFSFAVSIMQSVAPEIDHSEMSGGDLAALSEWFGSLSKTMWTLFMVANGGVEWNIPIGILEGVSHTAVFLLSAYASFVVMTLLNIITGVFLQTAIEAHSDHKQNSTLAAMRRMFNHADTDGDGWITRCQYDKYMAEPEMRVYLRGIGWRVEQAVELFHILDTDQAGEINLEDFLKGCARLQGHVKAVDFASFAIAHHRLSMRIESHMDIVERVLNFVETTLRRHNA